MKRLQILNAKCKIEVVKIIYHTEQMAHCRTNSSGTCVGRG